jgi:hypothetical protein
MQINFEYKSVKGLLKINTQIQPIIIKDNGEEMVWFNEFKKKFGFSKKLFLELLEHWIAIRFSKHTAHSYTIWTTVTAIPADFFYPLTQGDPKPKAKYVCALTGRGVQIMELLDSLISIEEEYEEFAEQWFKDYITFVKETK